MRCTRDATDQQNLPPSLVGSLATTVPTALAGGGHCRVNRTPTCRPPHFPPPNAAPEHPPRATRAPTSIDAKDVSELFTWVSTQLVLMNDIMVLRWTSTRLSVTTSTVVTTHIATEQSLITAFLIIRLLKS